MTVNVLLEDSFDGHQGNDLYDPERALYRVFRVRKQATLHEFLELLRDSLVSFIFPTIYFDTDQSTILGVFTQLDILFELIL